MSDCTCHERTAGICDVCREGSFGRYLRESLNRRCAECDRLEAELRLGDSGAELGANRHIVAHAVLVAFEQQHAARRPAKRKRENA